MNQDYEPTQHQQGNQWNQSTGNPPQQYAGGGMISNQMNYALWADRLVAALIDFGVALGFMVVLYIVIFLATMILGTALTALDPKGSSGGFLGCGGCLLWFILPPLSYFIIGLLNKVYWVSTRGYSIGQGVMKLKVVDKNGSFIPMGTSVLRLLVTVVLSAIPIVGGFLDLLFPLFDDPTRQTLHDKAVGTFVIKTQ